MNTLVPIQSLIGSYNITSPGISGSGVSGFENVLRASANSRSDADNAKLDFLNTKYQVEQATWNLGSTPTPNSSTQGIWSMALQDLTAPGGELAVPAWVSQAQRAMGDSFPQQVVGLYTQAQQMLTGNGTFSSLL
jgi:hypothetical protein